MASGVSREELRELKQQVRNLEEKERERQGGTADLNLSDKITAHLRGPAGDVTEKKIDDPQKFSHDGHVYMVKEPVKNEKGERILVYDVGNPIPIMHGGPSKGNSNGEDSSEDEVSNLTGETYVSSVIKQLAKPKGTGPELDIIGKLKKIPVEFYIFVLALLALWKSGTLGGLLPF